MRATSHAMFSPAWRRETGLGCAVGLVVFQMVSGLVLSAASSDALGGRLGPMHVPVLLGWHVRLGLVALASLPLAVMGHPSPRLGPDGEPQPCSSSMPVRWLGTLSGMALAVLFFTGPAIAAMRSAGLSAPREVVAWHVTAAGAAVFLLPLHLALAVWKRLGRWARQDDAHEPRFRGHWRAPAAILTALLALRLAQATGLIAAP